MSRLRAWANPINSKSRLTARVLNNLREAATPRVICAGKATITTRIWVMPFSRTAFRLRLQPARAFSGFCEKAFCACRDGASGPDQANVNDRFTPERSLLCYSVLHHRPVRPTGAGDTPSRRRIFVCRPSGPSDEISRAPKPSFPRWHAALTGVR